MYVSTTIGSEGNTALLMSPKFTVTEEKSCISYHMYMVSSPLGNMDALRVYVSYADLVYGSPGLVQEHVMVNTNKEWKVSTFRLPPGRYALWFAFTMGFKYTSTVAIDHMVFHGCENASMEISKPIGN